MHQAFSKSHVDYMGPEFLNIAREKDWFSWKPNSLLFISLIKYSPYQTSFMSVKFTKELKKFENHENKREKKMYDFIQKPTWACIWRGNEEAKTRGMRSYLLQISLFLDSFKSLNFPWVNVKFPDIENIFFLELSPTYGHHVKGNKNRHTKGRHNKAGLKHYSLPNKLTIWVIPIYLKRQLRRLWT